MKPSNEILFCSKKLSRRDIIFIENGSTLHVLFRSRTSFQIVVFNGAISDNVVNEDLLLRRKAWNNYRKTICCMEKMLKV